MEAPMANNEPTASRSAGSIDRKRPAGGEATSSSERHHDGGYQVHVQEQRTIQVHVREQPPKTEGAANSKSKKCTFLSSVIGTQVHARRRSGAITMKSAVNSAKRMPVKARSNDSAMTATGISPSKSSAKHHHHLRHHHGDTRKGKAG